jgi:hypothetical protein
MGALDPLVHKRNQQSLPGSHGEVARAASDSGQHIPSMDELPMDFWPSFATSEDYYPTVVLTLHLLLFSLFLVLIFLSNEFRLRSTPSCEFSEILHLLATTKRW